MSNIFILGDQVFNVFDDGSTWRISVNGILLEDSYPTRSDAWIAGVAEVDRVARALVDPTSRPGALGEGSRSEEPSR